MFKNYFKTAWRIIWRNKIFSSINILGLAIGISASLVIFMMAYFEFSHDKFEKDNDRIYRIVLDATFGGTEGHSAAVPAPLGSAISNEITGIEKTVSVFQFQGDASANVSIVKKNADKPEVIKKQKDIVFTNAQYLDLLGYQWMAGNAATSLSSPYTTVLTESRARQYFPGITMTDIVGRQIAYDDITTTISGIVRDLNQRTDFAAKEFVSLQTIEVTSLKDNFMMDVWNDWMAYTHLYVKLTKDNTIERATAQINALFHKHYENKDRPNDKITLVLQPLSDIHFNSNYPSFNGRIADRKTLYGLVAIAAFLLLLGCINFINLSTAQSSQRAKEIGIRKTMGGTKKQLIFQVLSETFLITVFATLLSVILIPLLLKLFSEHIPQELTINMLYQPMVLLFIILLAIIVSLAAGFYPAMVLCGYKPVSVLKNQVLSSGQSRHVWVRKTLTVSQFVIAQFFVIATVVVGKQISYSLNTDMGFNKEAVVKFDMPRDSVKTHKAVFLSNIRSIPGVEIASSGFFSPADQGVAFINISYNNGKEELHPQAQIRWGDSNYLKVYDIKIVAGRNVSFNDSIKEFLINETFAHNVIGVQHVQDAVGKYVKQGKKDVPIVGVMKDFHDMSLKAQISPMVFNNDNGETIHIKLKPTNTSNNNGWAASIKQIEKAYKQMYPDAEFNYEFVDEMIAQFYKSEQATAGLLRWATGLAILISCLGLFGLVIYTTNSRTKEIGIRKILGAPVVLIVSILSREFVILVMLAFAIAAPIAWWASYNWLQAYAYRTQISWWIFALSGLFMLVVALLTLSIRTINAALANPVRSLRTE